MPRTERRSLADWLTYQEQLHPNAIDLGLERLQRVLERLKWRAECPVITVGGTNGKGSCVALLESILSAAGYRVGAFTSPHLIRYNERIRVGRREVSDEQLVAAFEQIENARGDVSLTFFEFNALAALLIFRDEAVDAMILEVGLGGRLDAVNVVDADVAIVASIALDHCEWLGNDVESIGREKAGIFRKRRPAIFGARSMPRIIESEARRIGAELQRLGADFDCQRDGARWTLNSAQRVINDLPPPALPGTVQFENAATVLTALDSVKALLPIDRAAIDAGLRDVVLQGRFQIVKCDGADWMFDVAHNPAAATILARNLKETPSEGRTIAVCGILSDKDFVGVIAAVKKEIDRWVVAELIAGRALAPGKLAKAIAEQEGNVVQVGVDVVAACSFARSIVKPNDRVVVFGSFYTVGPALEWMAREASTGFGA